MSWQIASDRSAIFLWILVREKRCALRMVLQLLGSVLEATSRDREHICSADRSIVAINLVFLGRILCPHLLYQLVVT